MIEKNEALGIGDTIKVEFENFLGQMIIVTGIVRRIDHPVHTIVGNDIESKQSFFVSRNEILEINGRTVLSGQALQSLREVS